jgi:hypothetical protein
VNRAASRASSTEMSLSTLPVIAAASASWIEISRMFLPAMTAFPWMGLGWSLWFCVGVMWSRTPR